jgi:glycolate oxidase
MSEFKPVTSHVVKKLRLLLGKENVLTQQEEMKPYSYDEAPLPKPHIPELVVKPRDTTEVAKVLALANEVRIPVTPRGGGTGLSGGAIPILGGIVLSLEKMNRIKEIDEDNFMVVVEPGVLLKDLYQAVESRGLYYPLYTGEKSAHIGGNVATNAGGMRAVKYGVTRNFVLGLEAVLPTGQVVRTGGKFVKCSTAYDLTQLLVGSEGTLAVITEITLRLITPPGWQEVIFIPFPGLHQAIKAVPEILKQAVPVMGLEFLEKDAIDIVEKDLGLELPFHEHDAFLLGILEGNSKEEVYQAATRVAEVCTKNGAIDVYIPMSARARRKLLEAREKLYPALKRTGAIEVIDVVVPRSQIANFVAMVKDISQRYGMPIVATGHAGDGNVHLQPMGRGMDGGEWATKLPRVMEEVYRAGVSLGGTISGEHGLGFEKKKYLEIAMSREQIDLMARLKRAFDPNYILNPGKIFDEG